MPVFLVLLILLISIPVAELYVLISIGQSIGAGTTIALVILTAVLGAWLLRWQGLTTIARAQASLNAGELPAVEMIEGLILLITGVMLLTPGFITDALGFACLLPWVRRRLAMVFAARMVVRGVGSLATRPDRRREGWAGCLLEHVFAQLVERERASVVFLYADIAPGYYARRGFQVVDKAPRGADGAVLMVRFTPEVDMAVIEEDSSRLPRYF